VILLIYQAKPGNVASERPTEQTGEEEEPWRQRPNLSETDRRPVAPLVGQPEISRSVCGAASRDGLCFACGGVDKDPSRHRWLALQLQCALGLCAHVSARFRGAGHAIAPRKTTLSFSWRRTL